MSTEKRHAIADVALYLTRITIPPAHAPTGARYNSEAHAWRRQRKAVLVQLSELLLAAESAGMDLADVRRAVSGAIGQLPG